MLDRPGAVPAAEWKDSRERLAVLARYPEMSVAARGYSRLRYQKKREMLVLGVSVNGKPADFTLDTGASLSVMAESRARSLGLTIHSDAFTMSDIAGKKLPCRVATAGEIAAGSFPTHLAKKFSARCIRAADFGTNVVTKDEGVTGPQLRSKLVRHFPEAGAAFAEYG